MADLERMKVEELRHWYESWYAPTMPRWWWSAMSPRRGQRPGAEVLRQHSEAHRATGKLPLELAEPGQRQLTLHVRTQLPSLIYGFSVPGLATARTPAPYTPCA